MGKSTSSKSKHRGAEQPAEWGASELTNPIPYDAPPTPRADAARIPGRKREWQGQTISDYRRDVVIARLLMFLCGLWGMLVTLGIVSLTFRWFSVAELNVVVATPLALLSVILGTSLVAYIKRP